MPFRHGIRTQQFIDVSQVGPHDRIKVTLENGQVVMLLLPEDQMQYRSSGEVNLHVDKQLTDAYVLEPLYEHAVTEGKEHAQRKIRRQITLEAARAEVPVIVRVRRDSPCFDDAPVPGKYLKVMALFPRTSGSGTHFQSPVKEVEFITI